MQPQTSRSQMVKGLVDLAVLTVLSHGESYGYEILSWFEKAGLDDVGHASLYGSLKRLEAEGSVTTTARPSPLGPARRYYSLSPAGEARRQSLRSAWQGLQDSLRMLEDGL